MKTAAPRTAVIGAPIFAARAPDLMTTLICSACQVQLYLSIEKVRLATCRCPSCGVILKA